MERLDQVEDFRPWGMPLDQYCMLMHLSQFAGFVVPMAGLILPIVMWVTNKDQNELVDIHGKHIMNWIISMTIYIIISAILMIVIVGIFTLIAVLICSTIFTILGAVKANNGEVYKYPMSITFFK